MAANLKHPVYDTDNHFIIDPISREMNNTACLKSCLIQHDHNSECFTFEVPKIIEGHDMTKCDSIQVHYLNIDAQTKEQSAGVYEVEDKLYSDDPDSQYLYFSWIISHNATKYVGSLNFLVRFSCYREDGTLSYVWNTAIYSGISISNGIDNGEVIIDDYADILNEWRRETEAFRLLSLEQTQTSTESDGVNIWTATFADGTTRNFAVRNGAQGAKGDGVQPEDLANYVQYTDVVTKEDDIGPIKYGGSSKGFIIDKDGYLCIQKANDNRVQEKSDSYRPLTPSNIDLAVKVGLTTNTIDLTAEEKNTAADWLGALKGRLVAGSYDGAGSTTSKTITFDGKPLVVFIGKQTSEDDTMPYRHAGAVMIYGQGAVLTFHDASSGYSVTLSWSENSVTLHNRETVTGSNRILDSAGDKYYWAAILENAD